MTQPNKAETKSSAANAKGEAKAADEAAPATVTNVGYQENTSFVPDPFFQYGTLDTSDTAGGAHSRIQEISPVFDVARVTNLETAVKALDPKDPTPAELVVLPPEGNLAESAKARLDAAVKDAQENPVEIGGPTAEQRLAAQGTTETKAEAK